MVSLESEIAVGQNSGPWLTPGQMNRFLPWLGGEVLTHSQMVGAEVAVSPHRVSMPELLHNDPAISAMTPPELQIGILNKSVRTRKNAMS